MNHSFPIDIRRSRELLILAGLASIVLSVGLLIFFSLQPERDPRLADSWFHFQIVSFTSLVAFVLAILLTTVTGAVADTRTVFSTLGLTAIAGIFLIHGLSTPGVLILEPNPAVVWSSPISMFAGAILFTLASWPWPQASKQWIRTYRRQIWLVGGVAYVVYVVIAFLSPSPLQILSRLSPGSTYVLGLMTLGLYSYAAYHFWWDYREGGQKFDATLAIALILLAEAIVPMILAPQWHLSWWIYHILMLIAFLVATAGVVLEYEHVRHFHMSYYFAGIGAITVALLAWIAGEIAARVIGPLVSADDVRQLRWGTTGIFVAMSSILFVILLQIVRRGDRLLAERTEALQRKRAALERSRMAGALVPIGLAIGSTLDLDEVLTLICTESRKLFGVDAAYLWLREGDELVGRAGQGHEADTFIGLRQSLDDTDLLSARIVREGKPIFVNQARTAEGVNRSLLHRLGVEALMGVPFLHNDDALGALMLIDIHDPDCFHQVDLDVATIFGQQAAMALTHARLYEKTQNQAEELATALSDVRTSYRATLQALSAALDARDRETEGHSQRVRAYALALANAVGIDESETLDALGLGALLHDVGKIGIPDAILHKPGALSDEEWDLMRRHPRIGYEILSGIPFLKPALPVVLYHHERWDGNGYPSGKRRDEIPLPARIFAVVDTLDAITSTRPYRAARPFTEARQEILRHRGTQFDPDIVDVFAGIGIDTWRRLATIPSDGEPVRVPKLHTVALDPQR